MKVKKYMKTFNTLIIAGLLSQGALAKDFFSGKISKFNWENLEVVYLEDDRFPTYQVTVYFADGALSDEGVQGVTSAAFDYMDLGTRRFSRQDIAENLEFFGANYGATVTHEYSTFAVSGLVKDIIPTAKKICHLFQDGTYPERELSKEKKRILDSLDNMVGNHGALASRVFREEVLQGSPYSYPVEGKKKDVKRWTQKALKQKMAYFNEKVKKRVYLTGPRSILNIKSIINEECGWKGQGAFVRSASYKAPQPFKKPSITLVPVPQANQAQIRIGSFLNEDEIDNDELMSLASHYLGGGFTSRLMRVLRVENGLTYGVGAYAGTQKQYGRAGISTSTKVESVGVLLEKVKETLKKAIAGEVEKTNFERAKGSLAGSYPFGFENTKMYVGQLLFLDHKGEDYKTIFDFPQKVRSYNIEQMTKMVERLFSWEELQITIVGPRSLKKVLDQYGDVTIKNYQKFL